RRIGGSDRRACQRDHRPGHPRKLLGLQPAGARRQQLLRHQGPDARRLSRLDLARRVGGHRRPQHRRVAGVSRIQLYPKAMQSKLTNPVLPDPWAEEALRRIDYDFDKLYGKLTWSFFGHTACVTIASRAATFDMLTRRFLDEHPDVTAVHLGCGLD